jgi:hypothetical protein
VSWGRFSPVFSTNKADCHDITEILLKEALNTFEKSCLEYKECSYRFVETGIFDIFLLY